MSISEDRALRTGGRVVADALRIHGVDTVFTVPGESFLPIIDGLYGLREQIRMVVCRQEGNAAHMADAYAKLTGRPGVCLVTRGPGSANAAIGIHTARQDSTPLVVLVGQVRRGSYGREAWQENDYVRMFGGMAKWVAQVELADRLPEMLARAFQVATEGRKGPVVLALPEDLLYEKVQVADTQPYRPVEAHPRPADMQRLRELLAVAKRPLLIVGGSGWSDQARADILRFARHFGLPVVNAFRRQDLIDNRDPLYAGDVGVGINPALATSVRESDLLLAVGTRLSETTSQDYTLIKSPTPDQTLVHVYPEGAELGRVYQPELPILSGMAAFASAAAALAPLEPTPWVGWTTAARENYLRGSTPPPSSRALDMGRVVAHLREVLPDNTIVTNGAGNYTGWVHRFFQYRAAHTQLAPTSGAMGYGIPAACAAALLHPDRTVVCFAGDGCFQMSVQELATVRQYKLRILFIVVNNGIYGSIRMHQEIHFPGNVYGTDLENPDFVALAQAYGLASELVTSTDQFAPALSRALAHEGSALLELRTDPDAITTRTTLTNLREKALALRPAS